ncbi:MAG TPA: L-threonylcarbamoyladenylate synthase, partial [Rhizobiaceae bacterium]|nr:L-threonylcarbamoyladenylate synthase [Rhizobiaceae bacterium]
MAQALQVLQAGGCVGVPTETVYGLAADATNGLAVARIFEMKGRPRFNPLICHVADIAMAGRFGAMDATARRLAARFWPGPLTLVVPSAPDSGISELATAGLGTIGLRCPDSAARALIAAFGRPLAAPSANRSGRISPTTAFHVAEEFRDADLLVLDGGPCREGIESTIVKVDADRLVLLRPGSVT